MSALTLTCPEPRGYPGNLGNPFADRTSEAIAVVDLGDGAEPQRRTLSCRTLDAHCDGVARGLRLAGVHAGDRVAILSLNRWEFVATLLGAMRAGVVPVPINIKLPPEAVAYIVRDAGVRLAFVGPGLGKLLPAGMQIIEFGRGFDAFCDPGPFEAIEPAPDTVAIQPYTSGSTGRPKGVLLSHYGQNWSRRLIAWNRRTTAKDALLVAAPLYHKNALNAIKQGFTGGAKIVLLPQFDVGRYLAAVGSEGCTVISGVPTMMAMLLAQKAALAATDTSSVRTVMMGSAPASPALLADMQAAFPGAEILVNYGITEGGPLPLGPHPDSKPRPLGSVGYPAPGVDVKLVGGPTENEGEFITRNPGILLGYHNLPAETAKRIRDGWYYTGDILKRDAEGFYTFVGRTDDMFVCGGENIFPVEVESLLERHPAVNQAVVLPFAHELKGQVPYAFVTLKAGAQTSEDELKAHALAHGPAFMHPRRVFILDRIPLGGTNKVDVKQLRAGVAANLYNNTPQGASHG
ncbi:MAG: class I adenylate-forming enzyme family protein [Burkholderiales bacterium]